MQNQSENIRMNISIQINRITFEILSLVFAQFLHCTDAASSIAPTTTDPPTTTGTVFTMVPTESQDSSDVKFTDPVVYGPVAGGAALLLVGVGVALAVAAKKGMLSGGSAAGGGGTGAMFGNKGVAPQSTALVERTAKTKVFRSKVKPMKLNVKTMNERKPSLNIIRIERTTLSFHSFTESKL